MNYSALLIGSTLTMAVVSLFIGIYILMKLKSAHGFWKVSILFFLEFIYAFAYTLELASEDIASKMIFNHLQYFAIPFIVVVWIYVAKKFCDAQYNAKFRHYALLLIIPMITFVSVQITYFTDFNLYYSSAQLTPFSLFGVETMTVLALTKGPLYFLNITYNGILTAYVAYIYINNYRKSSGTRKNQSLILSICSFIGLGSSLVAYFTEVTTGIDWSLFILIFISYIIIYAILRFELFELQPEAYRHAFEINTIPLMILNEQRELVAWNKAASDFMEAENQLYLHMPLEQIIGNDNDMLSSVYDLQPFSFNKGKKRYVLETITLLTSFRRKLNGYLLKFNEITTFVNKIEKLDYQASHDELTGLLNRRAFHEKAREYLSSISKPQVDFSIIYLDIDDFKAVNDTYSHVAGDYILKTLTETIAAVLPENSLFARYGGEEFVLFLEEVSKEEAIETAQNIRLDVMNAKFVFKGQSIKLNVSLGLYNHSGKKPTDIYNMIFLADKALYNSKKTGKNRLTVYEPKDSNGFFDIEKTVQERSER